MNIKRNCIVVFLLSEQFKNLDDKNTALDAQKALLKIYLQDHPDTQLLQDFYQIVKKQKNKNRWQQIKEALLLCKNNGYSLIIPELKNHYGHQLLADLFTETFKDPASAPRLICLDQPLVNNQNISSLIEQLKKRREKHGELIKQGLNRSDLKSGNPKASEIIHRVNRPKILFSILFSILIEPIVSVMEEKKLAQRKMVDFLNMNHFYAPEGGRWVLSQFQKVYDRLKLNRLALAVEQKIKNVPVTQTLIHDLNLIAKHLLPPSKLWTQELVISAQERLADLEELAQMLKAKKAIELSTNMFLSDDMTHSEILNRPELSAWVRNSNNESYIKSA